jgi:transglutaminase-like putative cysteine protease
MVWLVRRLQPREGWYTFLLLLATVTCLPAAALAAEWVPADEGLLPLALVALLVGRWLAWREDWGWDVWLPVGASLGLLAALSVAAHVVLFLPESGEPAFDFAQRWVAWLEAAFSGGTSEDPDVFLLYAALLCWGAILLAAWAFYRRRRPLLALLSPVMLSAVTIFYSGRGILWLVGELGLGVLLLAMGNLDRERRTWEAAGVDYATGLSAEVLGVALLVAAIVVLVSLFGPEFSVRRISDWFWRTFREPSDRVEDTAERLFGGVSPPEGPAGRGQGGAGVGSYMPQSRLLGGRPDLLDEVVMVVRTDEPPPPPEEFGPVPYDAPRHYWRGATTDYYSGRGWAMTVDSREEVEGDLPLPSPPAYREVEQRFAFTAPHGDTLYALNAPAQVAEPVELLWRIPPALPPGGEGGDLSGLASEVVSYTVVSRVPTPTADDLQAIPPLYPPELRELYLQLPDTLPQRVVDLAWEVVAEGETVYERARLLERYLRAYPYSLDVERPPEGRDVADYFLFEMREGYCDYYATAFVVMARAVGIPARLASGYVGGTYDFTSGTYLVHQFNGHSWPEVYFPGWGWIGFEPTAAQPMAELPQEVRLPEEALPGPTGPPARVVRLRWRMVGLGATALMGLGLAGAVWIRRRRQQAAQVVTLPLVWAWVGRRGARLGLSPDLALTPREYAAALAAELRARAQRTRRWRARWAGLAAHGGTALERLAVLYGMQVYGRPRAAAVDEVVARGVWVRLRRPLRWFGWLGWAQRLAEWVNERVGRRRMEGGI